jgi:hypothetical protein
VHSRFKHAEAWSIYRRHVREGKVFAPIGRNYLVFVRQTLDAKGRGVAFRQREPKELTVLDDLK